MSTGGLVWIVVAAVVAGLLVALAVVWLTRRRLSAQLADERVLRGPEIGSYRGATGDHYPRAAGDGAVALTAERLVVRRAGGASIDIPLTAVTDVRSETRASGKGGGMLVVGTAQGDVSLRVRDVPAWVEAVSAAVARKR